MNAQNPLENALRGMWPVALTVVAVAIVLLVAFALLGRMHGRAGAFPVRARRLLTRSENEFLHKLIAACDQIGGLHVCPQVCMGAVMDPDRNLDPQTRMSVRNRFGSKIIDFVLIDEKADVRLIVELDDPSHRGREDKDRERDAMTASAGLRTLRIPDGRRMAAQQLAKSVREAMSS